jgi:hypothetical protein
MNAVQPLGRREEDLAFFGAVTASLSHQINNVFTIVNELNGLVEDLLFASGEGRPIPPARLKSVAEKIGRNVGRGTEYVRLLNRFAHSADPAEAEADVCEVLLLFEALSARFLDLKQAKMALSLPPEALPATTKPFTLVHALFVCLQSFLEGEGGKGPLRVTARAEEGRPVLRFEGPPLLKGGSALESRLDLLGRLAGELGARAQFDGEGETARFEITLPA